MGGLSALAIDDQFSPSGLGTVIRFDRRRVAHRFASICGPGPRGKKWARTPNRWRDPGAGWWFGYEQHHFWL
jgi:hypothetical protein